ncbi:MAG: DUF3810 domain-containing protein [Oscillospiraceae bacterium]|nr:DUF3810 domain-containing protein [Oscillospiraceae bacterium]
MKKAICIPAVIIPVTLLINLIARISTGFSDFYVRNIFPVLSNIFSFISGLFKFSLGEVFLVLLAMLIIIGIPVFIIILIKKKNSRSRTLKIYLACALSLLAFALTTETFNCFIMYQATPFSEVYFNKSERSRKQLTELYSILVDETNSLAEQVQRDSDGNFIITCNLADEAKKAMKNIGEKYPQFRGYYPNPKPIKASYIMSQTRTLGVYFPFTMEANYNPSVYDCNLPNTICHEFSHLKGIIREDEAGFFAFIASVQSDNIEFQYSGYLNALEYVNNEIYKNNITEAYEISYRISEKTSQDMYKFVPEEFWEENKDKEIVSSETVGKVSDSFTDTNLKINGIEDGIQSYSRIVNLLLDYYFGE